MSSADKSKSPTPTRGYYGPRFEESDAYKAVSLHVEENLEAGRKKENKRQKRMEALRELDKPESEAVEKTNDNDFFY